ncbi:unnamed protein product [Candidula unifasciata]|uniref:Mothers against decapentaplegic homolog n=1 Tax=Candidula unifasciata TaxID=100452 RepID=A0A8S3YQR1_9EUPU|nr:unnamed protein product [Candidula unifasciata]
MFRSKRNSLVKRLWKYRINDETRGSSQKEISPSSSSSSSSKSLPSSQEDVELKSVTHSFFKRLKEDQLKILVQAMESKGGEVTPCVPVPKSDLCLGRHTVSPYVLCCRVFRWPDLRSDIEMKRLPSCTRQNEEKESVVCCNPYHWSLVVKIDEPPIHTRKSSLSLEPLQRTGKDSHKYGAYRGFHDLDTYSIHIFPDIKPCLLSCRRREMEGGHTSDDAEYDCLLWCTIAYWELRERVGRLFSVTEPSVHIFQHLPHGDGMCLRLFQKPTNIDMVKRTREKIGFGIILSREAAHRNNANSARAPEEASSASTRPVGIVVPSESSPSLGIVVPSVSSPLSPDIVVPSVSSPPLSDIVVPSLKPVTSPSCARMEASRSQRAGLSSFPATSYCKPVTSFSGTPKPCDSYDLVACAGGGGDAAIGCEETEVRFKFCDADCCPDQAESQLEQQKQQSCEGPSRHVSGLYNESSDLKPTIMLPQTSSTSCSSSSLLSQSSSSLPLYTSSSSVRDSTGITGKITAASSTQTTSGTSFTSVSSDLPCRKGEVWAYNASNFPIFVNSPTLDDPKSPRSLVVKKVPPGYSIKIFDYARAELLERTEARSMLLNDGPFDPCSVRISLAKGWGPSYSRQFITSCPCWLEVLLGVKRHSPVS